MTFLDRWADIVRGKNLDLSQPLNYVSADDIRQYARKDPRLMISMDAKKRVPSVLSEMGIFVLAVSNDRFALVRGKGYMDLEDPGEPKPLPAQLPFEMTTFGYGGGETGHLLRAYHGGVLSDFTGIVDLYPTVGGHMGTHPFDFKVDGSAELSVTGGQMDVDMGFESRTTVLLLEAKARRRPDFLIRQLYYPMRSFREFTAKTIRSVFFVADQTRLTYSVWEYKWTDPHDYETACLVKKAAYLLTASPVPVDRFSNIEPNPELNIVPQADTFSRVAEFPLLVASGISTPDAWADHYHHARRQGKYYQEAASALGLVSRDPTPFRLTDEGRKYVAMNPKQRGEYLAPRMLEIPLMNQVFRRVIDAGEGGVGKEEIAVLIQKSSHLRGTTPARRASTVIGFFRWMAQSTGAVIVKHGRIYPLQP